MQFFYSAVTGLSPASRHSMHSRRSGRGSPLQLLSCRQQRRTQSRPRSLGRTGLCARPSFLSSGCEAARFNDSSSAGTRGPICFAPRPVGKAATVCLSRQNAVTGGPAGLFFTRGPSPYSDPPCEWAWTTRQRTGFVSATVGTMERGHH